MKRRITISEVQTHLEKVINERWAHLAHGKVPPSPTTSMCSVADKISGRSGSCAGCPIYEVDKSFEGCANTPYQTWLKFQGTDRAKAEAAAKDQLTFLRHVHEFFFGENSAERVKRLKQRK